MAQGLDPPVGQHRHGVGGPAGFGVGVALQSVGPRVVDHPDDGEAPAGPGRQPLHDGQIGVDEPVGQEQVLGRVARHGQLGQDEDVGARRLGVVHGVGNGVSVALEVADDDVQLGQGDPKVGHAATPP
ncbi:MAG: hypothetical protein QOD57_5672, partial [Actinomycetota bacterium]|nr:hypothetical protein [Actinomycetota bacterium]